MDGTIVRVFATGRTHKRGTGEGSVSFNLFMVDTPEQDDELVNRCGHGVMSAKHFKLFLQALRTTDVSTNVEMYDRFIS